MNHKKYEVDSTEYTNDKFTNDEMEYIHNEYELYFNHNMKICRHCEGVGAMEFLHSTDACITCSGTGIYSISQ